MNHNFGFCFVIDCFDWTNGLHNVVKLLAFHQKDHLWNTASILHLYRSLFFQSTIRPSVKTHGNLFWFSQNHTEWSHQSPYFRGGKADEDKLPQIIAKDE